MEQDIAGSAVTGGSVIKSYSLSKDNFANFDIVLGTIILQPGNVLTLIASAGTTQAAAINWLEYE